MRARIPASSGLFTPNREISVYVRLRGGAERTRTFSQAVMSQYRGPEDSNFHPNDYQSLALSVRYRVRLWEFSWLAKCPRCGVMANA